MSQRYDAWLLSDDAHGIGVLGDGRGTTFAHGHETRLPLKMGTLGKAVGSYGGYLCASRKVIDLMRSRARTAGHSTGLPPATAAAALAALELIERSPSLTRKPLENAKTFASLAGLLEPVTPIVPLIIGSDAHAAHAASLLEGSGFFVSAIRAPAVPKGTARLRVIFTAAHSDLDIARFAEAVSALPYPIRTIAS
jgi:8-amino-7-oxononanoate synthase